MSSNRSSSASARLVISRRGRWTSRPIRRRFSRPVRLGSTVAYWPASPICCRTSFASRTTSRPSTSARPASGFRIVARTRIAVVLPAPLGPSSPKTVRAGTSRSIPSSAVTVSTRFVSPSTRIATALIYRLPIVFFRPQSFISESFWSCSIIAVAPRSTHPASASVGFMLSTLGHAVSRRFHRALEPLELHPREFAVLRAVKVNDGQSQQTLAERLHIPPSRIVAIVDELESRRLVERRPDPNDRRLWTLYVTSNGQALLDDAFSLVLQRSEERRVGKED